MSSYFTGDLPMQIFTSASSRDFSELGFWDLSSVWSGCIDAPDYISAGSTFPTIHTSGGSITSFAFRS